MKYYHMEVSAEGRFVYLPAERGRYIRTDFSAFFVDCPNQNCQAVTGVPCYNVKAYLSFDALVFQAATHLERKAAYQQFKKTQDVETAGDGKVIKIRRKKA